MKRMLVNATQEEELRVAMVDGQKLIDLDIEIASRAQKKANIYKGKITRVEPSLDAAFVNYGAERHGFLPLKEISHEYFLKEPEPGQRVNIREILKEGQDIVVQVEKEERGNKGAALTTFISLAGRFIVLMPNNPRAGGVSRRITGEDRDVVKDALQGIEIPAGMGVIVRTAGVGRAEEELRWDLEYLLGIWEAILQVVQPREAPCLLFQDSNAMVRALRDHLSADIGEILVDNVATFEEAREFMEHAMPQNTRKLRHYDDPVPLFTRFQIESQIESAFAHTVHLPSGGSIVIDHTEALISIDINSARATKGGDIEATALATNLEAADEVARQCRLRDLGGLLVIDFIDMGPSRNQRDVENRLREAVRVDRARVQIGRISRFGLLEMSRQRLRPSLGESAHQVCPRCNGIGHVRSVESLALSILRLIGEEARKERTAKVIAQLPIDVATYLLNEKRDWISRIEQRDDLQVILIANPELETPNYSIRRVRDDQTVLPENTGASYNLRDAGDEDAALAIASTPRPKAEAPAVKVVVPEKPATPPPAARSAESGVPQPGLLTRLKRLLVGDPQPEELPDKPARRGRQDQDRGDRRRRGGQGRSGGRNRGQQGRARSRGDSRSRSDGRGDNRRDKQDRTRQDRQDRDKKAGSATTASDVENRKTDAPEKDARSGGSQRSRRGRRRRRSGGGGGQPQGQQPAQRPEDKAAAPTGPDRQGDNKPGTGQPAPAAESRAPAQPDAVRTASGDAGKLTERPPTASPGERDTMPSRPLQAAEQPPRTPPPAPPPPAAAPREEPAAVKTADSSRQPQAERPPTPEQKPAAGQQPAADKKPDSGRLLPWEEAAKSDSSRSYKVWSSEGGDPRNREDR